MLQDLRYAVHVIAKDRWYALVAIVALWAGFLLLPAVVDWLAQLARSGRRRNAAAQSGRGCPAASSATIWNERPSL